MENILITDASPDYELLDSGDGLKLERYGSLILSRPDPQALWNKSLPKTEWEKADAVYIRTGQIGKWDVKKEPESDWKISLEGVTLSLKLLPSKHLGVFPEQSMQWRWLAEKIVSRISPKQSEGNKSDKATATSVSVLNLFGYTGGASLVSAKAGAEVCHVDASDFALDKLKENMMLSGLSDKPVRLIADDVRKFVEREIKRGNKYDVIILDPPVYGKGANDQVWNIETDLMPLLLRMKEILSSEPLAVVLNGYASIYSHLTYKEILSEIVFSLGGEVDSGELAIKQSNGRLLSTGIFARWSKE